MKIVRRRRVQSSPVVNAINIFFEEILVSKENHKIEEIFVLMT